MLRELMEGPKPWSRRCVMVRPRLEFLEGLKSLRGLLLVTKLLLSPMFTVVPVRKPLLMPKLETSCRCTRKLVPVTKALLCGWVAWAQLKLLVSTGSRLGICGPEDCSTPPPIAEVVAALACDAAF